MSLPTIFLSNSPLTILGWGDKGGMGIEIDQRQPCSSMAALRRIMDIIPNPAYPEAWLLDSSSWISALSSMGLTCTVEVAALAWVAAGVL